jgi:hypothetical protein
MPGAIGLMAGIICSSSSSSSSGSIETLEYVLQPAAAGCMQEQHMSFNNNAVK